MPRSTLAASETITKDDFLGGKVKVLQPKNGYRAGVDAVLLAASVQASAGQNILELGLGVGTASLCLNARVSGLSLTGVELQNSYAELARENAVANDSDLTVIQADLRVLPVELRQIQFEHVIMNPPYFDRAAGASSDDPGRDIAMGGATDLAEWISVGAKRLLPKGYLTLIQRIERLPEVLGAAYGKLGSIVVRPIAPRMGRSPNLFLMQARHSGRAPFRLLSPLVMHKGGVHEGDFENYRSEVKAILRDGAHLGWDA